MRRIILLCVIALAATACGDLVVVRTRTPNPPIVDTPEQSVVLAADGSQIGILRLANRTNLDPDEIPDLVVRTVLAAEDQRFFEHHGVDGRAVLRAALANRRAGRTVQGGSTITQQLIKTRHFPDADETMERKAGEALLARRLEETTSKDVILSDYLNAIYFGAGAYGLQAAAETYFDVDAEDLDLAQAALLAGLIRSPEGASPHRDPDKAMAERRRVLDAVERLGWAAPEAVAAARAAPLGVEPPPSAPGSTHPRYLDLVQRTLLADPVFGPNTDARARRLLGGGLVVHTALDPRLQADAEAAATALSGAGDPEVAIAVVRPSDGHLVAAVGGRDDRSFDLATQAKRQPGSAFKTFAYAAALADGRRPFEVIDSGSVEIERPGGRIWTVRSATAGELTLHDALVSSSNGAFARLGVEIGPGRIAALARAMGITSEIGANDALVLGGLHRGVSPLEMASAYATLANEGLAVEPVVVTHVTDADGRVVWRADASDRRVLDVPTAYATTSALVDVVERGTGTAAQLTHPIARPAAGKTGTSQGHRDAWFVGYTPQLAAAVWVGYPDAELPLVSVGGVAQVEGGTWPARIWRSFMEAALADEPALEFRYPSEHVITVEIDPESGGLATEWCPTTVLMDGLPMELPGFLCPIHGPDALAETATVRPAGDDEPGPADPGGEPVQPPAPGDQPPAPGDQPTEAEAEPPTQGAGTTAPPPDAEPDDGGGTAGGSRPGR